MDGWWRTDGGRMDGGWTEDGQMIEDGRRTDRWRRMRGRRRTDGRQDGRMEDGQMMDVDPLYLLHIDFKYITCYYWKPGNLIKKNTLGIFAICILHSTNNLVLLYILYLHTFEHFRLFCSSSEAHRKKDTSHHFREMVRTQTWLRRIWLTILLFQTHGKLAQWLKILIKVSFCPQNFNWKKKSKKDI